MISYNNSAPTAVNNVGQFGATEGSIGAYKSAAEYAADSKYWALLSQKGYDSMDGILKEVERLFKEGALLEEDIEDLKRDFENQNQVLTDLIQQTGEAIDNTNTATENANQAVQDVLEQLDKISDMSVVVSTLPSGTPATGSFDSETGVFSFGIPEGLPGKDGADGTISDIGDVAIGTPVSDDYGFFVDKTDGSLYRTPMSEIAKLVPSVDSFNGRVGQVVPAAGDYTVAQITGAAASGVNDDINQIRGLTTALSIDQGGTGATTAADARANLNLDRFVATASETQMVSSAGSKNIFINNTTWGAYDTTASSYIPLGVAQGGTGATTAADARMSLVAAKSGDNSDITSMTNKVTFTQSPVVPDAVDDNDAVTLRQLRNSSDSDGILSNEQAVARHFGVKQSEVVYFSVGAVLDGYKVIYDKESQRAYSLPADLGSGVTAVSLNPAGVLVHSAGNVDLGALGVAREEYVTLPGSFETGVTVNTKNELVVFTNGKYRWDGALPKEVPAASTPASAGGEGYGAWISVGDASLRTKLISTDGFSLVGTPYGGTLRDTIKYGTPEMYLSVSSDVTAAIQNATDNHDTVDMSGRDWTIERPIILHDGNSLDLRSANITSNVGIGNHIFVAEDAIQKGINVVAGGGLISGTAKSVFYFQGKNLTPTASAHYARNIRISGVYCSSDNIDHLIYMYGAVRQVFLNNCYAYVKGGMYAEGKIVEIYSNNCIWFGSGSATASDARLTVKAINSGYVPEGFHFTENLFDGTGYSWIVTDMYVMTVSGGYVGGDGLFGQPTALNHLINITGSECKGSIIFSPTSANDYRANIQPAIMHSKGVSGSVIIGDNANGINVTTKLLASAHPSNAGVGVVVGNGCTNIQLDLSVDQTYDRAAAFNGASGERCSVLVRSYLGNTNAVYSDRPVNIISSPVTNSVSLGLVEKYENIPANTYAVGSTMASVSINAARGKRGVIVLNISLSGLAAGTSQVFTVTVPSNLIVPSGTGWTSLAIRPQFTSGLVNMEIPFYTNADIVDGSISVSNLAGNSAVVALNAYIGYRLL